MSEGVLHAICCSKCVVPHVLEVTPLVSTTPSCPSHLCGSQSLQDDKLYAHGSHAVMAASRVAGFVTETRLWLAVMVF